MVNLKRILVTTDLSDYSLAALEYAKSFGLVYASRVYVLYVADVLPPVLALSGADSEENVYRTRAEAHAKLDLEKFVATHISPSLTVVPVVRTGIPADEIIRFAQEESVDLVVMATHGRTGLRHMVLGSVAETVVRRSRAPVLTVKPSPVRESILRQEDIENELHLT